VIKKNAKNQMLLFNNNLGYTNNNNNMNLKLLKYKNDIYTKSNFMDVA
jgi:hypothetical protein